MSSGRRRQGTSITPAPAGGHDPKRMRPGLVGAGGSEPLCTQGGGRSEVLPSGGVEKGSSAPALLRDLTVDEHLLECSVCFLAMKPPIFQCGVGHVLCSPCSEKLKDAGKCHQCGVAMPDGYQRCHAIEDMMNSIRGPCPHAPYGCRTRPVYHAREEHLLECPHAPCHCPGDGCSFVGSVTTLVQHLIKAAHKWPCTTEGCRPGYKFDVKLCDGFNFLTAVRGSAKYLLLLNMASTPFGRAISAVWIGSLAALASNSPALATRNTACNLSLMFQKFHHYQSSTFKLECTCPPDPNASFQFFIPKYISDEATVEMSARISISLS